MTKLSAPITPSQAADMLGVSKTTVRRYADTFQDVLPDFGKQDGQRRTFTFQDVLYLWAIIDLHKRQPDGTSRDDVLSLVQDPTFDGLVIPDQLPPATTAGQGEADEDRLVPVPQEAAGATAPVAPPVDPQPAAGTTDLVPALADIVGSMKAVVEDFGKTRQEDRAKTAQAFQVIDQRIRDLEIKTSRPDRIAPILWSLAVVLSFVLGGLLVWIVMQ
jgi:DNA-binding transcriptional MerR regulator